MATHTANQKTGGILTTRRNIFFTNYDPYLSAHELEANDALNIQHTSIDVDFDALGNSRSSVRTNPVAHFRLVKEKDFSTAIVFYPKPLLVGSTSFFY